MPTYRKDWGRSIGCSEVIGKDCRHCPFQLFQHPGFMCCARYCAACIWRRPPEFPRFGWTSRYPGMPLSFVKIILPAIFFFGVNKIVDADHADIMVDSRSNKLDAGLRIAKQSRRVFGKNQIPPFGLDPGRNLINPGPPDLFARNPFVAQDIDRELLHS